MSTSKNNARLTAYIENTCVECEKSYSSASTLIKHMKDTHKIELTARKSGYNRPSSTKYTWVSDKRKYHRRILYGCPSCWFHCPQDHFRLKQHIEDAHLDEEAEAGFEESPIDEDDFSDEEEMNFRNDDVTKSHIANLLDDLTSSFKSMWSATPISRSSTADAEGVTTDDDNNEEKEKEKAVNTTAADKDEDKNGD